MNRAERRRAARVREVKRTAAGSRRGNGDHRDPISRAIGGATKLTAPEILDIVEPARASVERMTRGVGLLADWQVLASTINVAKAIERQGIVRGLAGHLTEAEATLATIHRRAEEELQRLPEARYPYALHLAEIDVLKTAIELLFEYQLKQLTRSELRAAMAYAIAEVASSGGQVIDTRQPHVQAALPLTN